MSKIAWTDRRVTPFRRVRKFWDNVAQRSDGCWIWQAGLFSSGYGQFRWGKKKARTHRIAWMLSFGPVPDGKLVCHTCDNKNCVNPNHLFLGTHKDNAMDRECKGRGGDGGSRTKKALGSVRGERNPAAKISPHLVSRIRMEYQQENWSYRELANIHGLSKSQIANIIKRRSWSHVR